MQVAMYAVKDNKVGSFMFPFPQQTNSGAIRDFATVCNDQSTLIGKYPADFELWQVGVYDQTTGILNQTEFKYLESGANLAKGVPVNDESHKVNI